MNLFSPLKIKNIEFKNRIIMSPMCMYSASEAGEITEWHKVHYGSRAIGGCGLIIFEATAVEPAGRISGQDLGLWNEKQSDTLKPVVAFIQNQNCRVGVQLAHAGRKTDAKLFSKDKKNLTNYYPKAPSAISFSNDYLTPHEMTKEDLNFVLSSFVSAAEKTHKAGLDVIELHMAHGYLLHEFLSPISNKRNDEYGGSLKNRMRFPLEVAHKVRQIWPQEKPLFVRISATDWIEGGWDLDQTIELVKELKKLGVDLIDVSSGGLVPQAQIPVAPAYQVPFADEIKKQTGIITGTVGLITEPHQANKIVMEGKADFVFLGRELLRNPQWPLKAARELGVEIPWPQQYLRAK